MPTPVEAVKMQTVDEDSFVAFGYLPTKRELHVTLRNGGTVIYQNVPGFRYEGLRAAPRKEAYFKTFVQNAYLNKPAGAPPKT